jgi:hypothetical protein
MLEVRRAEPGVRNGAAPADSRGGVAIASITVMRA